MTFLVLEIARSNEMLSLGTKLWRYDLLTCILLNKGPSQYFVSNIKQILENY